MTIRKIQTQAQKWPRPQQTCRKVDVRSDWSDLHDGKDNQTRGRPIAVDITSDHETNMDQQPSSSTPSTSTPLRRPNTLPRALSLGRGKDNFLLANWTSVAKGHGCRFINRCDILQTPPENQEPTIERNLAIVAPTDRVPTFEGDLAPVNPERI